MINNPLTAGFTAAVEVGDMSERALMDHVEQRRIRRYGHLLLGEIALAAHRAHERFTDSPIRDFVPLLVEQRVAQQLSTESALIAKANPEDLRPPAGLGGPTSPPWSPTALGASAVTSAPSCRAGATQRADFHLGQ
ncbi:MAG: hypothetical protein QOE41_3620 [Mycobacterium sp.]|nr:Uncharacterized protein [Mycobacterium sp.]MDT5134309.1 hypothetical protein [Mycobacterium sp.]